eukprot:461434-Pelagomonas_calceolata.AAC.23
MPTASTCLCRRSHYLKRAVSNNTTPAYKAASGQSLPTVHFDRALHGREAHTPCLEVKHCKATHPPVAESNTEAKHTHHAFALKSNNSEGNETAQKESTPTCGRSDLHAHSLQKCSRTLCISAQEAQIPGIHDRVRAGVGQHQHTPHDALGAS